MLTHLDKYISTATNLLDEQFKDAKFGNQFMVIVLEMGLIETASATMVT